MPTTTFKSTLSRKKPPRALQPALQALWWDAKGDWQRAHEVAQASAEADSAWVHAYLHRKEGDVANARYWYGRTGKPFPQTSSEQEWEDILAALLPGRA